MYGSTNEQFGHHLDQDIDIKNIGMLERQEPPSKKNNR